MKNFYSADFKLGVLGGGQLGRMLIQSAVNFDIRLCVLDPDSSCPCATLAHDFKTGNIRDFDQVYQWGKSMDVITIEIENVNVDALEKLHSEGVVVFPQPDVIRIVQDKGLQKEFYGKKNIPTASFRLVAGRSAITAADLPCAQKLRTGGYDGRGVKILHNAEDIANAFDAPSVIESLVDFEKELSVIVSRNAKGETSVFDPVELEFNPEANLVEFLFSPADISESTASDARKIATDLIVALEMVGLLAVEMFLTRDGRILVNEIAPRPHNSGHQSIEANLTSQFEQHLRSILNLSPGTTEMIRPSVMVNLLGEPGSDGKVRYKGLEEILAWPGVYPHIYGKTDVKPFRKMGHVTILAKTLEEAKKTAMKVKNTLKALGQ